MRRDFKIVGTEVSRIPLRLIQPFIPSDFIVRLGEVVELGFDFVVRLVEPEGAFVFGGVGCDVRNAFDLHERVFHFHRAAAADHAWQLELHELHAGRWGRGDFGWFIGGGAAS